MKSGLAGGAAWMVLFRVLDRSVGLLSTLVLARLLAPADFGVVAMAMSFISLIELATAFSFEMALIQKNDPQREHFDTAWTLNIVVALAGGAVTALLAPLAAEFYAEPRLTIVMVVIGLGWAMSGFENVGIVEFRRSMHFSREFVFFGYKRIIAFVVTMACGFAFRSYWALVAGMVTGRLAGVALSFVMQSYRPRFCLAATRDLLSFSGWMVGNNLIGVALGRVPHFFVGRILGPQALGAYTVGSEIANLAHTELIAPINRALFPGFARLASDKEKFRRTCIDATSAVLMLVLPVSIGVAVLANPMVRVMLGEKWSDAVPVIQVLALSGAVTATLSNNVSAYLALGLPKLVTLILATRLAVLVPGLLYLSDQFNLVGFALAEGLAAVACLGVSYPVLFRQLQLSTGEFFSNLWRPFAASATMGLGVHALVSSVPFDGGLVAALTQLLVGVPAGVVIYVSALFLLWRASGSPPSIERMILDRGLSAWRARRSLS